MKKAIIVGATSGIGKELALILSNNVYKVGITGRRTQLLAELQNQKPDCFIPKTFDITDETATESALTELINKLGGLDLLVISSGTGDINESLDYSIEKGTIAVNVSGFTQAADFAFRYFEKQKHGHLAAITSIAGIRGSREAPSYNATKAYQINYMESLRQKSKHLKLPIHVTDIRPGFVRTDMAKGEGQFWVSEPDKAAKQIYTSISRRKKISYITKRWLLIAVILKLMPKFIYDRM